MDGETVATVIDRLVDLVHTRSSMSVKDAAKALAISESRVEEIANVLAASGMLRVRYTLTGIFLEPKRVAPELMEKKGTEIRKKELERRMKALEKDLDDSARSFRMISLDIMKHIQMQTGELKQIEGEEQYADEGELEAVLREATRLEKSVERFGTEMKTLKEQLNDFNEKLGEFEAKTSKMRGQKPSGGKQRKLGLLGKLFSALRGKRSG